MTRRFIPLSTILLLLLAANGLSGCATAVLGVGTAAVAASTTEKGLTTSVNDAAIVTKIKDRFVQSNFSLVTAVDVSVNDGSVLMTGKVKTPEEKVQATRIAWEIKGVREVVNELQVSDTSSLKDLAKDLAASATLRGKLIADTDISSLNFNIDVVNGTIYLSGIAADAAEMNRVVAHAQEVRFTRKVVNYIMLSTDKRY
ncbi:MAG: BON domain-containing protein [Candidatus Puniceispirillum sp.]|jgi:osmotically-inducible protein OsmY